MHPVTKVINALENIRQTGGRLDKEFYLREADCPELQFILHQVFQGPPQGFSDLTEASWLREVRDGAPMSWNGWWLAVRSLYDEPQTDRKLRIELCLMGAPDQSGRELLYSMLTQNLRLGVGVKTLQKLWPTRFTVFEVQLAKPLDSRKLEFPCTIEPKYDGVRAVYIDGRYLSRYGKELQGPQIECPSGLVLDGELLGADFQNTLSAVRVGGDLQYHVFDCITEAEWKAKVFTTRYLDRTADLCSLNLKHQVTGWICDTQQELDHHHANNLANGFEGSMVKLNKPYELGRSSTWMKIKPVREMDILVVGWNYGFGKYGGCIGALKCHTSTSDFFDLGSGFSDQDRMSWMTLN